MDNLSLKTSQTKLKGNPSRQSCIVPQPKLSSTSFQRIHWQDKPVLRFAISYISNFNPLKNFILFQKTKFFLENLRKDHNMMKIKTFPFFYRKEHSQVKKSKTIKTLINKELKNLVTFN